MSETMAQHESGMPAGYRMTELGPLPEEWRVVRLGEALTQRKKTVHPADQPHASYVGLEHIDTGEIVLRRFGRASETRSLKAEFRRGDILYGKLRPYLDKAAIADRDGVCSTDILASRGSIPFQ